MLKVGINIAMVTTKAVKLKQQYPDVFEGVGKLKNKQISLDIDPTVKPVAQPYRRIPFNLRKKVQGKTTELLDLGIIEPVEGPAPWVNPVVIRNLCFPDTATVHTHPANSTANPLSRVEKNKSATNPITCGRVNPDIFESDDVKSVSSLSPNNKPI